MNRWTLGRWLYVLEVIVLGLPSLAFCVFWIFLGFVWLVGLSASIGSPVSDPSQHIDWSSSFWFAALPALLVCGGVAGLTSWSVLSGHYLAGGASSLKEVNRIWWAALFAGMLVAIFFIAVCSINGGWEEMTQARASWFVGPAFLVPAAHLILVKLRP